MGLLSVYRGVMGSTDMISVDPQTTIQSYLHVAFQRSADSGLAKTWDNYFIQLDFTDLSTQITLATYSANFSGDPDADTLTLLSRSNAMRVTGNVLLNAPPVATELPALAPSLTLSLDVQWFRTQIDRHNDSTFLNLKAGERRLQNNTSDAGPASVTVSAEWTVPTGSLPISPSRVLNLPGMGRFESWSGQASLLPSAVSAEPIIQMLTPPNQPPRNAQVSATVTRNAYTLLGTAVGANFNGSINLAESLTSFSPEPSIPLQGGFTQIYKTPDDTYLLSAQFYDGLSISDDLQSADFVSSTTAEVLGREISYGNLPVTVDIHWKSLPDQLQMDFSCSVTTTPTSTTTEYQQTTTYPAIATGTFNIELPGYIAPPIAVAYLQSSRFLTMTESAKPNRTDLPLSIKSDPIPRSDRQSLVLTPWQEQIDLARTKGLLKPKPDRKINPFPLPHLLQRVLQYASFPHAPESPHLYTHKAAPPRNLALESLLSLPN